MRIWKKAVSAVLVLLLLSGACLSCSEGGSADEGGEPAAGPSDEASAELSGTEETAAEETPDETPLDTLEIRDFGGSDFTIIAQSTAGRQNFYIEDKDGDVMNDAVRARDLLTEDRLGVVLNCVALEDRGQVARDVQNVVKAGDEAYHLILNSLSDGINTLTTSGALYDLTALPFLRLEDAHWNESMAKNMRIYGKQYFSTGSVSLQYYVTPTVMVFNKRLAEDYGFTDINEIVLEGKWTADRLAETAGAISSDVDGDGDMDTDDLWGLAMEGTLGNSLFMAAGLNTVEEKDGEYFLTLDSQAAVDLVEKCASLFGDRTRFFNDPDGSGSCVKIFRDSRALLLDCTVLTVIGLRDMEDDFGIIPTPKYTEDVPYYYTACNTWLPSGAAVPLNCSDPDRTGLVTETIAAASYGLLTPAVYDVTLQGKVSRDEASGAMLDLIYAHTAFDLNTILNFGDTSILLRRCVLGEQENYVSTYAKTKKMAEKTLQKFVAFAKEG